jgi:hypothetical protein
MGAPPSGTGPASALGGMAGNQQAGMEKVKLGLKALTEALPMLPLGSELQSEIMKAVQGVGKHLAEGGGDPQALVQQLAMMARNAKTEPPPGFGQLAGGGAPPPGGAPPSPGMGAGGPPPPMGA